MCHPAECRHGACGSIYQKRSKSLHIQTPGVPVYAAEDAVKMADKIDVLLLCGGSATDLPKQTPEYAKYFNVVDS